MRLWLKRQDLVQQTNSIMELGLGQMKIIKMHT